MRALLGPALALAAGMIAGAAAVLLVRRRVSPKVLQSHNEGIENYLVILTALYGIMTAFVILNLWDQQRAAELNTVRESSDLTAIFRLGRGFSSPHREAVLDAAEAYTHSVIESEWDVMLRETADKLEISEVDRLSVHYPILDRLWDAIIAAKPASEAQRSLQTESITRYEDLLTARRSRLLDSEKRLVPYLWLLLSVGGLFTVLCTLYIGMENELSQAALTGMCAGFIALMLFVVHDLENPFRGSWAIEKEPYQLALMRMDSIRSGSAPAAAAKAR
jgi:Protein of unknown function (DUF4239)